MMRWMHCFRGEGVAGAGRRVASLRPDRETRLQEVVGAEVEEVEGVELGGGLRPAVGGGT